MISRIRTFWLIVLTLAATTLPATARFVPGDGAHPGDRESDESAVPPVGGKGEPAGSAGGEEAARPPSPRSDSLSAPFSHAIPPVPQPDDEAHDDAPTALVIAQPDVWDRGSTRQAECSSGPALVVSLLGHDAGRRCRPMVICHLIRVEAPIRSIAAQRAWLACRDAHAPPVAE